MPSNAEVAAKLLRDAAGFFEEVARQNPEIRPEMEMNAKTFAAISELVRTDPQGECAGERRRRQQVPSTC